MKRLFIAVNIPEEIKEEISRQILSEIIGKTVKVAGKENLHFTAAFLGNFPEEKIPELKNKLSEIELKKFRVSFSDLGEFNKRILFLNVEKGFNELIELSKKINEALEIKDEKFHPHLTLLRIRNEHKQEIESLLSIKFSLKKEFEVNSFELMESKLSSQGPVYSVLESFKLSD